MVELIVPNPSGADGSYIFPLTSVTDFCSPTMHDQFILDGLTDADPVSPESIRVLAAQAAKRGFAGRLAAKSAKLRADEHDSNTMLSYMALFVEVLRSAGFGEVDWQSFDAEDPSTRLRAKSCIAEYAPRFKKEPMEFMIELEKLSRALSFVGIGAKGLPAPADIHVDQLRQFIVSLKDWNQDESEVKRLAELIIEAAELTLEKVEQAIKNSRAITRNMPNLLRVWFSQRKKMAEAFNLADWMLDGWPYIANLWQSVEDHDRYTKLQVIERIGELVPLIPVEVDAWLGSDSRCSNPVKLHNPRVRLNEDWRTGTVRVNSVEHNEQLRAMV